MLNLDKNLKWTLITIIDPKCLPEYPFPSSRLQIRINFRQKNHYSYSDGSMESVTLDGDVITYFQEPPPNTDPFPFEVPVFAKESYQ